MRVVWWILGCWPSAYFLIKIVTQFTSSFHLAIIFNHLLQREKQLCQSGNYHAVPHRMSSVAWTENNGREVMICDALGLISHTRMNEWMIEWMRKCCHCLNYKGYWWCSPFISWHWLFVKLQNSLWSASGPWLHWVVLLLLPINALHGYWKASSLWESQSEFGIIMV